MLSTLSPSQDVIWSTENLKTKVTVWSTINPLILQNPENDRSFQCLMILISQTFSQWVTYTLRRWMSVPYFLFRHFSFQSVVFYVYLWSHFCNIFPGHNDYFKLLLYLVKCLQTLLLAGFAVYFVIVQVRTKYIETTCNKHKLGFDKRLVINNLNKIYTSVIWNVFLCYDSVA